MKFYSTPLSHFARKARIIMDLYEVPYDFVEVTNAADTKMENFASNPIMKVPILEDGQTWLIESDHIAKYIADKYDETDRYRVNVSSAEDLNFRAVLNGVMSEEVKYILAKRMGVPVSEYDFFDKAMSAIVQGLEWLESNAGKFDTASPKYREFHLMCLWDHLDYYELLPLKYPKLRDIVAEISAPAIFKKSSPWTMKPK